MYAKAHPFGYKPNETNKNKKTQCRGVQCTRVQTIKMTKVIKVPVYDKKGNLLFHVEHIHNQIKNIYHSDISHKSGYTLAEAYWNSVLNSNGHYEQYMAKFKKRSNSIAE